MLAGADCNNDTLTTQHCHGFKLKVTVARTISRKHLQRQLFGIQFFGNVFPEPLFLKT